MTENKINKLLRLPVYLTLFLIIEKFTIYLSNGSVAIFSLFTDSLFDLISSFFSIIAYKYSIKNKRKKHNYFFYNIINIITIIISLLTISTVFFIYYQSINNIINKNIFIYKYYMIIAVLFSSIISFSLYFILKIVYNNTKLLIIKSEMMHYFADALINTSVLLSIIFSKFIYNNYFIDSFVAMVMGYYIIKPAIEILISTIKNSFSNKIKLELQKDIINIVKKENLISDCYNFKIIISGEKKFAKFYINIDKKLSSEKIYSIIESLEREIESKIDNLEVIINC